MLNIYLKEYATTLYIEAKDRLDQAISVFLMSINFKPSTGLKLKRII